MKELYIIQPYEVGTAKYKSLAMIIPSKVSKKCEINTSSIFSLKLDQITKQIHLYGPNNVTSVRENIKSGNKDKKSYGGNSK